MFMDLMGLYGSLFLLLEFEKKKCYPRVNKVNKKKRLFFFNFSLNDFYEKFELLS